MTARERTLLRELRDAHKRLEVAHRRIAHLEASDKHSLERAQRRIAYLERDKERALDRARKAEDRARYWHGIALRMSPALRREKRVAA